MLSTNDMLIDMSIKEDEIYNGKQVNRIIESIIIQQTINKSHELKKLENENNQLRKINVKLLNLLSSIEPELSTK